MNNDKFYSKLRGGGLFDGGLTQDQVDVVNAILAELRAEKVGLQKAAYILATAFGETGGKMQPRYENMNYSAGRIPQVFSSARRRGIPVSKLSGNPMLLANTVYGGAWGSAKLGNTKQGDGHRFRGTGMGQITGRYNFTKWSEKMGIDFVTYPEKLMDLEVSVKALVKPMVEGWATGLGLDVFINATKKDYYNARKVWNGTFDAAKYATYAIRFETALIAGEYDLADSPTRPTPKPTTPEATPSLWSIIMRMFSK